MSGDRIVALVAIAAMLILVVPALARRGLAARQIFRMALIWAVIFLAVTAAVMVLRAAR